MSKRLRFGREIACHRIRVNVLVAQRDTVEDRRGNDIRTRFRHLEAADHVGVHRARKDSEDGDLALFSSERSACVSENAAALAAESPPSAGMLA